MEELQLLESIGTLSFDAILLYLLITVMNRSHQQQVAFTEELTRQHERHTNDLKEMHFRDLAILPQSAREVNNANN